MGRSYLRTPRWALAFGSLLAAGCPRTPPAPAVEATAPDPAPVGGPWRETFQVDHPLVGRIRDVEHGRWVDVDAMVADLGAADYVLLGEKHDNADHHRLQALVIGAVKPSTVAFEMLDVDDDVSGATDSDSLATAVAWNDSGWPDFEMYRPVFDALYGAGARVLPAHPTRTQLMTAMKEGIDALPAADTEGLALDRPLSDASRADLVDEIVEGHCGHADEAVVQMMITGQVLKDTWMARAMQSSGPRTALVAGGGHTGLDRGVPHYLDGTVRTVLFVEVEGGKEDLSAYDAPASYLWFTPRVDEEDPCEKFKEQLERVGKGGHGPPPEEEEVPEGSEGGTPP